MACTGELGSHEYDEKTCQECGEDFCFSCCESTNVHEGGKYTSDFMLCPNCGHDWYEVEEKEVTKKKKNYGMELKFEMEGRIFSITIGQRTRWFRQEPFIMVVEEWYGEDMNIEYAQWLGDVTI
jgi:MinD superfamily P-loop ATPase